MLIMYTMMKHTIVLSVILPTVASFKTTHAYYFTATPKNSSKHARGMNNEDVYGQNIITVDANELLDCGAIIPTEQYKVHTN